MTSPINDKTETKATLPSQTGFIGDEDGKAGVDDSNHCVPIQSHCDELNTKTLPAGVKISVEREFFGIVTLSQPKIRLTLTKTKGGKMRVSLEKLHPLDGCFWINGKCDDVGLFYYKDVATVDEVVEAVTHVETLVKEGKLTDDMINWERQCMGTGPPGAEDDKDDKDVSDSDLPSWMKDIKSNQRVPVQSLCDELSTKTLPAGVKISVVHELIGAVTLSHPKIRLTLSKTKGGTMRVSLEKLHDSGAPKVFPPDGWYWINGRCDDVGLIHYRDVTTVDEIVELVTRVETFVKEGKLTDDKIKIGKLCDGTEALRRATRPEEPADAMCSMRSAVPAGAMCSMSM